MHNELVTINLNGTWSLRQSGTTVGPEHSAIFGCSMRMHPGRMRSMDGFPLENIRLDHSKLGGQSFLSRLADNGKALPVMELHQRAPKAA